MATALQLSYTTTFGSTFSASYWKVTEWKMLSDNLTVVTISGWKDQASYDAQYEPFATKVFTMNAKDYLNEGLPTGITTMLDGMIDRTLDFIKSQPGFTSALKV